jgi:hypothetical protein
MAEVDDLKARFEQSVALFNARDLAAWATYNVPRPELVPRKRVSGGANAARAVL